MSLPKLNQLEMLVAVADTGAFGAAAAQMGCTQSRVSHAITELETILGARLLHRSRTGCTPTEAGFRVVAGARQILQMAAGLSAAAQEVDATAGHVRIASYRSVATHLLPPALEALAQAYPGIRIDIDDSFEEREAVAAAVREGAAQIGIAQLPVADDLASRPYVADAYVLVVPAAAALRVPVGWEQLERLPYIQLNCSGAFAILEQCRAAGFEAALSRTLATDTAIAAMVRRGLGYSILPRLAVFPEPAGVRVHPLPIAAERRFAVVARPETAREPVVQLVMRFLRERQLIERSEAFRAGALL
jgi:DNA-binding transcriptional LysR family regulator